MNPPTFAGECIAEISDAMSTNIKSKIGKIPEKPNFSFPVIVFMSYGLFFIPPFSPVCGPLPT
jgi:hypothetical protein